LNGGEIFFWSLFRGFHELGHHGTLYGAPGSIHPAPGCDKCHLRYIPGGRGAIGPEEHLAAEWYWDEVIAHDFVIDCQHQHVFAELAGFYYPDLQKKFVVVPNGVSTEAPKCGMYNVVVGSAKWRDLFIYGRSQFFGTPWERVYGGLIRPVPESDILGIVPWAVDAEKLYTPGDSTPGDYLLYLGRATPYKGLANAILVAAKARLPLVIVPSMELEEHRKDLEGYRPAIEESIQKGNQVTVTILPKNSQHHIVKRELYRRARALVFAVEAHEPFGLTMIEAMATGCPVLGTPMGAVPEIITPGLNGYLGSTVDELAEAAKAVGDLDRQVIRDHSVEHWHYRLAAERYLKLLEE